MESVPHGGQTVTKKQRLAEQTSFDLNASSLIQCLRTLPKVPDGKASLVLKGSFSDKPVAIRKIPTSFRDRADRDLKAMDRTRDLCETANYHFHFDLELCTVFLMPMYEYNLEEYLQIKELKKPSQNHIVYHVALGLSELHKRGIVHTDLRPTKIFIQCDLGKERIILSNFRKSKVEGTSTRIMTKSLFAAPEVRDRIPTHMSHKVDSFSLGMVAFFIWSYHNKTDGEAFRTFPSVKYIKSQRLNYLNEAEKKLLYSLVAFDGNDRPSAEEATMHPAFWGNNGIGLYMLMLDDILRGPKSKQGQWMKAFNDELEEDWREKVKDIKSGMKDPNSYTLERKCFVRFIRNLFVHYQTIETAKKKIPTREGLGDWVLKNFKGLFFDIFALSFRHMDGYYSRFFSR